MPSEVELEHAAQIDMAMRNGRNDNAQGALDLIDQLADDLAELETKYENIRKFIRLVKEFRIYIQCNLVSLINYGERYRAGERISAAIVESTVNTVISKHFAKKQQMQWSKAQ